MFKVATVGIDCRSHFINDFPNAYYKVVILNTDGKTFTLLENPQAMRLKKAGYSELAYCAYYFCF